MSSSSSATPGPGRLLLDVVRSLPNDDLALEYRSQTQDVEIVSGTAKFHLRTLPTEDFPKLPERDVLLGNLARRFLAGHGPADERDLAKFAGISLSEARRGFAHIRSELHAFDDGLFALAKKDRHQGGVRLLSLTRGRLGGRPTVSASTRRSVLLNAYPHALRLAPQL